MHTKNFKQTALKAAKEASKILVKHYGKKELIKEKPNKSLVSSADLEANKVIIRTIKLNFPNHSILSEETGFEDNKSEYKWVIDPLDGTHNFLHGIPLFGTSIALKHGEDIVLGVLHFPILNLTAAAEKGTGAFMNGQRINVSGKNNLNHSFVLFEFSYANREEKTSFLEKMIHKTVDVRNFGSAIYNLLLVACGKSESFITLSTNEWDVAAGFIIVEEAGGKITDLNGNKRDPTKSKFIVSNGKVHSALLKFLE